jgi:hypothetical protein
MPAYPATLRKNLIVDVDRNVTHVIVLQERTADVFECDDEDQDDADADDDDDDEPDPYLGRLNLVIDFPPDVTHVIVCWPGRHGTTDIVSAETDDEAADAVTATP